VWTNPFGYTQYWCEQCRRKYFPTDEEKLADAKAEQRHARNGELAYSFVIKPVGYIVFFAIVAAGIYGLVAFIHWCLNHS
jgi:hypothetical protein